MINFIITSAEEVSKGIGELKELMNKIEKMGSDSTNKIKIPESLRVVFLEGALPESSEAILTSWQMLNEEPTWDRLVTLINAHVQILNSNDKQETALLAHKAKTSNHQPRTDRKPDTNVSCTYCERSGHDYKHCRDLKRKKQDKKNKEMDKTREGPMINLMAIKHTDDLQTYNNDLNINEYVD